RVPGGCRRTNTLNAPDSSLILTQGCIQPLPSRSIPRHVVRRVDEKFHTAVGEDFSDGGDGHPDACDERHRGYRADLILMIFQGYGRIFDRRTGVDYNISNVE